MTQPTEPRPERPEGEREALERAWRAPRGWRLLLAVNNTHIGVFYIVTAMVFFVLAGILALVMRTQLAVPGNDLVGAQTYNQLFTMHGTVMMFLFAVPIVEAIAVYLLPGMLGARDLPFPRLSAYAFWAYAIGGLAFFCTIFFGESPDGGWFMYPPLTSKEFSPGRGADWWLLGIGFIEISAIAGAIELIIGILFTRAPGMTLMRMPVFAWAMLVSALMIVFAFPAVIAATMLLELERAFDWPFFIAARGGDPVLWQHLFWFFGHPEVYIIFLPAAGMVSVMVATLARTPLVGHRAVVMALIGVGVVSFLLWAHHMFTTGLGNLSMLVVSAASFMVAIPSGLQVFAWIATFWRGRVTLDAPTLFLLGFHFIFVLGGLTGVMVAVLPFDWQAHDSYFIVAHLHYVLIGGMVFPVFAGFYYWAPVFNGHRLSERWGRWVFGLMFGGFNLAFFPMHIAGLMGMPRRVYTYPGDLGWNGLNMASTVGAFVLAAGVLLFFIDAARTLRRPEKDHGNPWGAGTLEWLPPRDYGVRSIPEVDSLYPLWRQPALPEEVEAGRHWLPGTVFGGRETLVTSMRDARPLHLLRLPTDGWPPFVAAVGTAGFFLLLTVSQAVLAFAFGLLAIVAILWWLWASDQPPPTATADVGHGVRLPVNAAGTASHSWWAVIVLIAVDMTIFVSFLFTHIHLSMAAEVCPPPGAALPPLQWPLASGVLLLLGSAAMAVAVRRPLQPAAQRTVRWLAGFAMLSAACALGFDLTGHWRAGLDPRDEAWSASVGMLLGYQAFHVAVLLLMGGYVLVRSWTGRLQPAARATLDNTALMWHCVTAQGVLGALTVQLVPRVLG
ncbi:cytochrome c oxidase subunit I+III [Variovorax boronicumulans]|uniref:cytochrome c oxidase subunit I n=1 Tax=Variovorax boronicumulans TaxID=436515 RepID=UPI00278773C6|nr:cytochrome c oxidase subunit I [Variovorax boronicumulans]MDQ0072281.1 cytochrome c oxidase subunit I+III [Variovorax boronicumulans]